MAILILAEFEPTDTWFVELIAQLKQRQPNMDLRVWPEFGNPEEIEIVLVWWFPLKELQKFPNLKLIMSLGASVDKILADPDLPAHLPIVRLVSERNILQMVEYVLLCVLLVQRRFIEYRVLQQRQTWQYLPTPETSSLTVGILGLGSFGAAVGEKLASMGFPVRGWSRTPKTIARVECFYGWEQLELFLKQCHVLVCLLPVTPETIGILNNNTFSGLPQGAYLINVGQGKHLVEADLLTALESGQLAGACLDVFENEPLPQDHPFWSHSGIIVTPHISALGLPQNAVDCIIDAITRTQTGEPLKYLVDRQLGY